MCVTVESYELSPMQQGMLFHALHEEGTGVDHEQILFTIRGAFDENAFLAAFDGVVARHPILRTRFSYDDSGRPVQEVMAGARLPLTRIDLSTADPPERARRFDEIVVSDRAESIDLGRAPAMRLILVAWSADEHRIIWTYHHSLLDGRSLALLLREAYLAYEAQKDGRALHLPESRPYREYIEYLRDLDLGAAEAYWRRRLAGFSAPTSLGVDRAGSDGSRPGQLQGVSERRLPAEMTASLRGFAAGLGGLVPATLNTLVQAAWAVLLQRYGGETDVVFGATRACRPWALPDANEMVGLFINTVPMRVNADPERSLADLLKELRAQQFELRAYEHTPLARVQSWSDVERGSPLFESILVYDDSSPGKVLREIDPTGSWSATVLHEQTNYPLTVVVYGDEEMVLRIENDRRRVSDEAAMRMLDHLVTILTAVPAHANGKLRELPLLSANELSELLEVDLVGGDGGGCLHERFEKRARLDPERVAVVCGGESLSYGELDRRANGLALRLQQLGVGPDALVGLRCERTIRLVVGILGILKAGGAYVPLDPAYPRERVDFMVEDSGVTVVVTESAYTADFDRAGVELVLLDQEPLEADDAPISGAGPDSLAYVIYTSGSTGRPKGVLIRHRNVTRLFDATRQWFEFDADDVWTLFHSYAFDFSVWELWGALLHGGRLVVVPYWVSRTPDEFRELVLSEKVTVLNQTPTAFRQFMASDSELGEPAAYALRYVIFGGEALELSSLRPWFERYGDDDPVLVNMYGITETTVHVTYRPIALADLDEGAGSVIGRPIPDLRVLLLDADGQPVPKGVAGEMYVGGAGVSSGYLNRPELTPQRFVDDQFGGSSKLYRSGDLARRLENGELEYLGRIDDQVKIHGFRIELGEIEAQLNEHPDARDAVVIVREDTPGDKRLTAYVVALDGAAGLIDSLRAHLKARLPEYMVPAHVVLVDSLPLTPNGKLDRNALPAPERIRNPGDRVHVPPRTAGEHALARIWADVLGVAGIGITDNFFELGGDSILTIQVIARCRQEGLRFTPSDLFRRPTIGELAPVLEASAPIAGSLETSTAPSSGPVPTTPIQSWFVEQRFADPDYWNQAFLFEMPAGADLDALQQALADVVSRHDALRLRLLWGDGEPMLSHEPNAPVPTLVRVDLTHAPPEQHAAQIEAAAITAQSHLDLQQGPLMSAVHFERGAAPGRLFLAVHHLAVDGVSWRILIEDLEAAYTAIRAASQFEQRPRSASFQAWARALHDYAAETNMADSLTRWVEIEATDPSLPVESSSEAGDSEGQSRTITVSLGADETRALLQEVPAVLKTRINEVLLTALALALRGWTGRDAHRVDVEGHGREEWIGALDVSRTVGWFTSLYPVALDLGGVVDDEAALKHVKEGLRRVPDRGLSYGLLRYASPDPVVRRQLGSRNSELLFNYLGQFDQVVAGSDLFGFADEPIGPWHGPANARTHRLEVLAAVRDGRFEASWIYGADRDRPELVARLAEAFIAALRRVIDLRSRPGASGLTPSDFPLARVDQAELDRIVARHADLEDLYPLSPMQLLFLSVEGGAGSRLGLEQWVFRMRGDLDTEALRSAWRTVLSRHAILRTAFIIDEVSEPLQLVERQAVLPWVEKDWSDREPRDFEEQIESFLRSDRESGIDLGTAPVGRVALIRRSDQEHRLLWSTHHLCVDGWSWPVIMRDLGEAYQAYLRGAEPPTGYAGQYGAYVDWLASAAPDSRDFWQQRLRGFSTPTPLPVESTRSEAGRDEVYEATFVMDADTSGALQSLARELRVTLNAVTQGAWAILLGHLADRSDVVFGAAFSGRPPELDGVETLVGPCVNNLPVRLALDPGQTVAAWLAEVHGQNLEISQHQYAPLSAIQQWAEVPIRHRLFDSLLVFLNYQVDAAVLDWKGLELELLEGPDATGYPLTLTVSPRPQTALKLAGQGSRFAPESLSMMLEGLVTLLSGIARRPDSSLVEIASLLPGSTKGAALRASEAAARQRQSAYVAPGTETERLVASVWEELFGVDDVGVEDNFFELGGHSLMLVEAHARLRERVRSDLPVVALLQYPTVRSLARYLNDGGTSREALGAVRDRARLQRQALARQRKIQGRR